MMRLQKRRYTSLPQKINHNTSCTNTGNNMNLVPRDTKTLEYIVGKRIYTPSRGTVPPAKYNFLINNFAAYIDDHNPERTVYLYITNKDIDNESVDSTKKNTVDITGLNIMGVFTSLPYNIRIQIRKRLIIDINWLTDSNLIDNNKLTIINLLASAPQALDEHYKKMIFDLFLNKPSLENKEVTIETQIVRDNNNINKLVTSIHIEGLVNKTNDKSKNSFFSRIFGKKIPTEKLSIPTQTNSNLEIIKAYAILGLPENSDFSDVKERFHKLIKFYHPDIHTTMKEESIQEFQKVNSAFQQIKKYLGK